MNEVYIDKSVTDRDDINDYLINKVETNEGYISIYDRRAFGDKFFNLSVKLQTRLSEQGRHIGCEFTVDHDEEDRKLFHPNGTPGAYENHFHLKIVDETKFTLVALINLLQGEEASKKLLHPAMKEAIITENPKYYLRDTVLNRLSKSKSDDSLDFLSFLNTDDYSDDNNTSTDSERSLTNRTTPSP